jgi:phage anti-repressor protein
MIDTYETSLGQTVRMTELYDYLEMTPTYYNRWVSKELLNNPYVVVNKDYCTGVQVFGVGRKRKEYDVHIDCAKKLCMVSKSAKGNAIRDELVKLTKQIDNKDLLNEDEILTLSALIGFFKFVENQKEISEKHANTFVAKNPSKYAYAEFHSLRNRILGISKEEIEKKLIEYCTEQSRRYPNTLKTTRDKIIFLDMYDSLKNAVWDFLYINGAPTALKMAELAKKMAKVQGIQILAKNESSLWQEKELLPSLPELKKLTNFNNPK